MGPISYLKVIFSDARDKTILEDTKHKKRGQDKVGEECDEVGQLSIGLGMKIIWLLVFFS